MEYDVYVLDGCSDWMGGLPQKDRNDLAARIDLLAEQGPALSRPAVDGIKGSRHANMKELRHGKLRVLFAFDPKQQAVLSSAEASRTAGRNGTRRTSRSQMTCTTGGCPN